MKNQFLKLTALILLGYTGSMSLTSCEKKPSPTPGGGDNTTKTSYVIASTVGDASYLLTSPSIDEGQVSALGNGTEVTNGSYWVFKDNKYLFALVYNKGGAGTGASYYLNSDGVLTEKYIYEFNRITTYGIWGDNVVTASTGNSNETDENGNIPQALLFNYLNANDGSQKESSIIAENFLDNGEKVTFAGLTEANGKLYTSVIPMGMSKYGINKWPEKITDPELIAKADGGSGSGSYQAGTIPSTQYPDSAFVAIYNNSFNETPIIARTGKMGSACGRRRSQYYQTIWSADNGDIYVFSPGYGRTYTSSDELKKVTGTLPSAVMRIKAGETDFDPSYYVNLEAIGTNKPIFRCWHISQDYFLLQLYKDGVDGMMQGTNADVNELAIFKGNDQTIIPVTGFPADLAGFGGEPYGEGNAAYVGVTVTGGDKPAYYKIDLTTGSATKGISVDADALSGLGVLEIQN